MASQPDERESVKSEGCNFIHASKTGDAIFTWDFSCRALALLATVTAAASIADTSLWLAAVIAFGLSHYLLSFYYAAPQIKFLFTSPSHQLPGVTLLVTGLVLYFTKFPLAIFFALHHGFNEGYLRNSKARSENSVTESVRAARALLHGLGYLVVVRHEVVLRNIPEMLLWLGFAMAAAFYWRAVRANKHLPQASAAGSSSPELLLAIAVLLSLYIEISWLHVVFYHFALWALHPVAGLSIKGSAAMTEYVALTIGSLVGFFVLATTKLASDVLDMAFWYGQFYFWSYVHIATSLALSKAHPAWIVRLFQPQAEAR